MKPRRSISAWTSWKKEAEAGARFESLPGPAASSKNYAAWKKSFAVWLFQTQQLTLLRSPSLEALSQPGEAERDFRIRLQQAAREERDQLAESLKQKYAAKFASLAERKRRAEVAVEQQKSQQSQRIPADGRFRRDRTAECLSGAEGDQRNDNFESDDRRASGRALLERIAGCRARRTRPQSN